MFWKMAVMAAAVRVVTVGVGMERVTDVFPAGMMAVKGVPGKGAVQLRVTARPSSGAGPVRVMVALTGSPPLTVVGLRVRDLSAGEVTTRVADVEDGPTVTSISVPVADDTGDVAILNVPDVFP